jgi:hypothetical protein
MKHPRAFLSLFTGLTLTLLFLQACAKPLFDAASSTDELPTVIPPYIATDQAAALEARATIQAGQAQAADLAVRASEVALNMTAAAATEEAFVRQTERSHAATVTAQSNTQTAAAVEKASTATQIAQDHHGTETAIALGILQASATAEVERIAGQREAERQTLLFRTWAGRIALVIVFFGGLFVIWQSVSWILLRAFGIHRWANRPVVITPDGKGGFNVFDISRSLQPGVTVSQDGHIQVGGGTNDLQLQSQVTARAQAAELMLAANSGQGLPGQQRRGVLHQALQSGTTPQALPPGEIVQGEVVILPPDDPRIRPLLDEVETKMLEEGVEA